jgi:formylglycine-generating enzyme required for sulfatase activity
MVSIVAPFYMGKYEVTGEQYAEVMGSDPSKFGYPRHPVENVTWRDAKEFCRRVTEISGYVVRMPSEDEWECACGRESWIKCNIELEDSEYDVGWHSQNSSSSSHAVGDKIGNVFGLHDTMGNVSEWCKDEYMGFLTRPHSGGRCKHLRAIRGGNWRFAKQKCQPHVRDSRPLDCSYDYVGFRVVSEVSKISSVQAWEDMCK